MQIQNKNLNSVKRCPVCQCEYVHPVKLSIILKKQEYSFTADKTTVIEHHSPELLAHKSGEGVATIRQYYCEEGQHSWEEIEEFSKGNTFTSSRILSNSNLTKPIWRD